MRIAAAKRKKLESGLSACASAEHKGEAYEGVVRVCEALGLPKPQWSNRYGRAIFEWELEWYQKEAEALGEDLELE